jgi:hypothetical protein
MGQQGLRLNNVVKYLETDGEQVLGSISGLEIRQYACFLYCVGNGSSAGAGTVDIPRLVPPSNTSGGSAWSHCCGIADSWGANTTTYIAAVRGATDTTTGDGQFSDFAGTNFSNTRPFMVGLIGDTTSAGTNLSLKMNGVTKANLVQAADQKPSMLRQVTRVNCPLVNGYTGSVKASKWGNCVVIGIAGVSGTATTSTVIATVPSGYRPEKSMTVQIIGNSRKEYYYASLSPSGDLAVEITTGQGLSDAWGGVIFGTSNSDSGSNIFSYPQLKMNGVTKTLMQVNNTSLTCRTAIVSGSGGNWYLWKWGHFVAYNVWGYSPGQTGALSGKTLVTFPEGFRPASQSFSNGYGFAARILTPAPASGNRIAINIVHAGNVQAWSKTGFQTADTTCGASGYFYSTD